MEIPADEDEQRQLLRGLMNVRAPQRIGPDFLQVQDDYLQDETAAKGITDLADLTPVQPGLYLWQGDITTLQVRRYRERCKLRHDGLLRSEPSLHRQRHPHLRGRGASPCLCGADGKAGLSRTHRTGKNHAGVQPALPVCAAHGRAHRRPGASPQQDTRLCWPPATVPAWSWQRSTGWKASRSAASPPAMFCFPERGLAAEIAVQTVREFLQTPTSIKKVIFNVFKDLDKEIYDPTARAA